jgi:hypothetical protein
MLRGKNWWHCSNVGGAPTTLSEYSAGFNAKIYRPCSTVEQLMKFRQPCRPRGWKLPRRAHCVNSDTPDGCTCCLMKYVADVTRASKSSPAGVSSNLSLSKWDACWWVTTNGTQYPAEAIRCNKKLKGWWTALRFRELYSSNASGTDGSLLGRGKLPPVF